MSGIITLAGPAPAFPARELRRIGSAQPFDDGLVEVRGQIRVDEHHTRHARIARDERGLEPP